MARALPLQRVLNDLFTPAKRTRQPDHDRRPRTAFQKLVAARGTTYTVSRDGYVEIMPFTGYPQGITICHHGWDETLERLEEALEAPWSLDENGYHNR